MRQSVGVWGTKWLIRLLYPEAVACFEQCAKQHDIDYKQVDWSQGADATAEIDRKFWACCQVCAADDLVLLQDAELFYQACRKWGRMRAVLWKIGLRY